MKQDEKRIWLGHSTIYDLNRVVVPDPVVDWNLVAVDERVFWAVDDADAVYLSKHRTPFANDEEFTLVGDTTLGTSRGVTVPAALFADASPAVREVPVFERGETVGFVATDAELRENTCRVLPNDVARETFGDRLDDG